MLISRLHAKQYMVAENEAQTLTLMTEFLCSRLENFMHSPGVVIHL